MFVKDFMTGDPVTVSPTASISDALATMQQHSLKRLPVMEQGQLVGLITDTDLMKALPSPATALSKHEINYLTAKIAVSDMMSTDVLITEPDHTVEEAVMVMRQHDVGCLPVVDNNKLIGIITESNVFSALTELLGLHRPGLRITIEVPDRIGVLANITHVVKELGIAIISLATVTKNGSATIILRAATDHPQPLVDGIEGVGYKVLHVANLP